MPRTVSSVGVTWLLTRRQRAWRALAAIIVVLAVPFAFAVGHALVTWWRNGQASWPSLRWRGFRTGGGALLQLGPDKPAARPQFPLALTVPGGISWPMILIAALLLAALAVVLVRPAIRAAHRDNRTHGLATDQEIRRAFGARRVRRTGKVTRRDLSAWQRFCMRTEAFGYQIGRSTPGKRPLWVSWDDRMRVVARAGWGKTWRLLVPTVRALPGPALVASNEPEIFRATVTRRQERPSPYRWWARLRKPSSTVHPVVVVDCSNPEHPFAPGWPAMRWNPIIGCTDEATAERRARALVSAGAIDDGSGSDRDEFFITSATAVLAAWFRAAALDHSGGTELRDLEMWLRTDDLSTPRELLERAGDPASDAAIDALATHLDPRGERTTSSVKRFVANALRALTSDTGERLCGSVRERPFDMAAHVNAGGTVYLLIDSERMGIVRPLVSLIAAEMFVAVVQVANSHPGNRLPQPFVAVLDELRYGVFLKDLPEIGNTLRKKGVCYLYAVQTAAQEEDMYGRVGADTLRAAASTTLYGGYDAASAKQITSLAGRVDVVQASRGGAGSSSEHVQSTDVLHEGDLQRLGNGDGVVAGTGIGAFLSHTDLLWRHRRKAARIRADMQCAERGMTNEPTICPTIEPAAPARY